MKKGIIIAAVFVAMGCLLITQKTISTSNNQITESEIAAQDKTSNGVIESADNSKDILDNKNDNASKDETTINEVEEKADQGLDNNTNNNQKDKVVSDEKKKNKTKDETTIEDEGEFFDTSDKDPFFEEQHKSDVPLVLVDQDGNEMQPETVYWDEESGRGTLDPSGYIPEGLPPGAVFVCEITPEEEERLREEFNVQK